MYPISDFLNKSPLPRIIQFLICVIKLKISVMDIISFYIVKNILFRKTLKSVKRSCINILYKRFERRKKHTRTNIN